MPGNKSAERRQTRRQAENGERAAQFASDYALNRELNDRWADACRAVAERRAKMGLPPEEA